MNSYSIHHAHRGFTLVEIIVVVTIIGILASLVTYSFSGVSVRYHQKEVDTLKVLLNRAVSQALINQESIKWKYSPNKRQYQFFRLEQNSWTPLTWPCPEPYKFKIPIKVTVTHDYDTSLQEYLENDDTELVFTSAGEYTAFTMVLVFENTITHLVGDGINNIVQVTIR